MPRSLGRTEPHNLPRLREPRFHGGPAALGRASQGHLQSKQASASHVPNGRDLCHRQILTSGVTRI
jgi:hypothetical protein